MTSSGRAWWTKKVTSYIWAGHHLTQAKILTLTNERALVQKNPKAKSNDNMTSYAYIRAETNKMTEMLGKGFHQISFSKLSCCPFFVWGLEFLENVQKKNLDPFQPWPFHCLECHFCWCLYSFSYPYCVLIQFFFKPAWCDDTFLVEFLFEFQKVKTKKGGRNSLSPKL